MKSELIKQLTKKMIRKIVVFVILMIVVTAIGRSIAPTVSNELALTQMQNSNEAFVLMNTYNKIRPIVNIVYVLIVGWFAGTVGRDIYKFNKTVNTENTENAEV